MHLVSFFLICFVSANQAFGISNINQTSDVITRLFNANLTKVASNNSPCCNPIIVDSNRCFDSYEEGLAYCSTPNSTKDTPDQSPSGSACCNPIIVDSNFCFDSYEEGLAYCGTDGNHEDDERRD